MNIGGNHVTYCLNIHPGETLLDVRNAIKRFASKVKSRIAPDRPFGLGLRLSREATDTLRASVSDFREELDRAGMYAFTVNGFPYGRFHDARVKETVYQPDWTHTDRLDYTLILADILAALLPDDADGSISTVPLGYGPAIPERAVDNLVRCAGGLADLEARTGKRIVLALEPEPDCALDASDDVARIWDRFSRLTMPADRFNRYIGVCVDACHAACAFEDPADYIARLETLGIAIPKIQISSALVVPEGINPAPLLTPFIDDVYLHQTRVKTSTGILRFSDLPDALAANPTGEWRVHYHVPLHRTFTGGLQTTAGELTDRFFRQAASPGRHLEVETYTFNVLPGERVDIVDSIVSELNWTMQALY